MQPAADAEAARWLVQADVRWRDLVTFGPPGFGVRVGVAPPYVDDADEAEMPAAVVRVARTALAAYTTTPDRGTRRSGRGGTAGGLRPARR